MFAVTNCRITCKMMLRTLAQPTKRMRISFVEFRTHFGKRRLDLGIYPAMPGARRWIHEKGATSADVWLVRIGKHMWDKMFGKYLFATNVIGSGVLMVVGDAIAQEYEYRRGLRSESGFDYPRIWRMFVAGALQGPLHHWVYNWMETAMPQRTFQATIKKILIDQFVMSPLCIVIFFYSICFLENQNLECTNRELKQKFPYIYLLDWMTWPAAQYVNFRYVDIKYRVAFVNVCTAVYNIFISYMKHDFGIDLPLEMTNEDQPLVMEEVKIKAQ